MTDRVSVRVSSKGGLYFAAEAAFTCQQQQVQACVQSLIDTPMQEGQGDLSPELCARADFYLQRFSIPFFSPEGGGSGSAQRLQVFFARDGQAQLLLQGMGKAYRLYHGQVNDAWKEALYGLITSLGGQEMELDATAVNDEDKTQRDQIIYMVQKQLSQQVPDWETRMRQGDASIATAIQQLLAHYGQQDLNWFSQMYGKEAMSALQDRYQHIHGYMVDAAITSLLRRDDGRPIRILDVFGGDGCLLERLVDRVLQCPELCQRDVLWDISLAEMEPGSVQSARARLAGLEQSMRTAGMDACCRLYVVDLTSEYPPVDADSLSLVLASGGLNAGVVKVAQAGKILRWLASRMEKGGQFVLSGHTPASLARGGFAQAGFDVSNQVIPDIKLMCYEGKKVLQLPQCYLACRR